MERTDNLDRRRVNLEGLIKKLRDVTLAVQIMPFVCTFVYIICMIFYWFSNDTIHNILDTLFYVSPIVVVQMLILSRLLRLCMWHRVACILPVVPQFIVLLDYTLVIFSVQARLYSIATMLIMSCLLLVAAYKVFFANGR